MSIHCIWRSARFIETCPRNLKNCCNWKIQKIYGNTDVYKTKNNSVVSFLKMLQVVKTPRFSDSFALKSEIFRKLAKCRFMMQNYLQSKSLNWLPFNIYFIIKSNHLLKSTNNILNYCFVEKIDLGKSIQGCTHHFPFTVWKN